MKTQIMQWVDDQKDEIVQSVAVLVHYPSVSPHEGGTGEVKKAQYIAQLVEKLGLPQAEWHNAPDEKAPEGYRPNLIVRIPGATSKRLWIISHMDVVPEGDLALWHTDPFTAVVKDGRVYGRGSNDNGQELIASLYAASLLTKRGIQSKYEVCLCFVADEEVGSVYGIQHLIQEGIFQKDDCIVVPDGGNDKGDFIEVAEKSILWLEFSVEGEQVHASRPDLGLNACRIANIFAVELDRALHEAFPDKDSLFNPSVSTFEPTRRNSNVGNVNTIPGKETFCFDCRILPSVNVDAVLNVVSQVKKQVERAEGGSISFSILQRTDSTLPTPSDAPVVRLLASSLREVYGFEPVIGGVGGGTCAAFFRKEGIPAVVWAHEADVAHMPNEYCEIEHLLNETKVFALMMAGME
ncbi:MAG TPA: diaminopimelate aminotransferase [Aminobacterium sp.]|uniref:M20 family metallo-hydrolase n=1 Tax=Aminobacterium TaxID=81466 RepID=UPI000EB861DD|nr:M20 family metallo-hydrolase [Aminobacterium sp. UBA4834]HCA40610.1 diaminopimelate aminotransferase [Aminobacterium sp.]